MMIRVLAVLLAFLPLAALSQPTIPATPAGAIFEAWLTSYNSADPRQVEAFIKAYERKSDVQDVLNWRKETGGFELLRIEVSEPSRLVALIREKESDRAERFQLTFTGEGKGDNLRMELRTTQLPDEFAVPRLPLDAALDALSRRADELARADRFAGTLLVARDGKILFEKAYGKADRQSGRPNSIDTQFRLGSMNKMFTAVTVLQLAERGRLSLEGTVGTYLPEYPGKEIAAKVTVRQLLTHTGGTGDIFGPQFTKNRLSLKEHSDYVKLYGERVPDHEPGKEDRYSNYGYVLLGAIIERVAGVSYYAQVSDAVYRPARMEATGSLPETSDVPLRVVGYMKQQERWVSNVDTLPYRGMAAGGGYSTAGDLLRFAQALQAGKLISEGMLAEATRPQDIGKTYGFGFGVQGDGSLLSYGHAGGAPGMNSELRIYPKLGYVLIGLSNLDPPAATRLIDYFAVRMPVK